MAAPRQVRTLKKTIPDQFLELIYSTLLISEAERFAERYSNEGVVIPKFDSHVHRIAVDTILKVDS